MAQQDIINHALTLSAIANSKTTLGDSIRAFFNPLIDDASQVKTLDFTSLDGVATTASLAGLEIFTNLENLIIGGNGTTPTLNGLIAWAANISHMTKLKKVILFRYTGSTGQAKSNVVFDVSNMLDMEHFYVGTSYGLSGDLSVFTKLKYFYLSANVDTATTTAVLQGAVNNIVTNSITGGYTKLPTIGNNKNLISFSCISVNVNMPWTISNVGTLSNMTKLVYLDISNGKADAATINYILAQLKVLKQTGTSPLTTIIINGANMAAPTGQGLTDKTALQGLGVTVTTT